MAGNITFTGTLETIRLALGGALIGSVLSGALGYWGVLEPQSERRELTWAAAGFVIALLLVVRERRKTAARNKAAGGPSPERRADSGARIPD